MKHLVRSTLFRKTLALFVGVSAVIYGLYLSVLVTSRDELANRIGEVAEAEAMLARNRLEDRFEQMQSSVFELVNNELLHQISASPESQEYYDLVYMLRDFELELSRFRRTVQYLDDIRCYLPKTGIVYSVEGSEIRYEHMPFDAYRRKVASLGDADFPVQLSEHGAIVNVLPIEHYGTYQDVFIPYYLIQLFVSSERIQADLERYLSNQRGFFALESTETGRPLALSGEYDASVHDAAADALSVGANPGSGVRAIDWDGGILLATEFPGLSLRLLYALPRARVEYPIFNYYVWLVVVSVISVAIVGVLAAAMRALYVRPLDRLVHAFEHMENGDFTGRLSIDRNDEFDYLYDGFNRMAERTHDLIHRVYEQNLRLQRSELEQLQYQINPHFLYNSLYLVYRMARFADVDSVELMSRHLSSYYKYLTETGEEWVRFVREVEHIRDYLQIQATRFENSLDVQIDPVPERARDRRVPRLILQPLVENAFVHGFANGEGTIHVGISADDRRTIVTVDDSGAHTTEEHVHKLRQLVSEDVDTTAHVSGVRNVHRRLRILYGSRAGIRASRSPLGGMRVELHLPEV